MKAWIGLTVAEILAICGIIYKDVHLIDEPPGKLRGIEFTYREGGQPRRVVLEIGYNSALFSQERSWDQTLVEAQKIVNVRASSDYLY